MPVENAGVNYTAFRGMLFKSERLLPWQAGLPAVQKGFGKADHRRSPASGAAQGPGNQPRSRFSPRFFPQANGVLDDHSESWFLSETTLPATVPEGMEAS